MKKVYVFGSANVDYFIEVDKIPIVGETILGKSFEIKSGGKGANQAVAAHKAGANTRFMASIGKDENGEFLRNEYKKYNLDTKNIFSSESLTGTAIILLYNKDNLIVVNSGSNNDFSNDKIIDFFQDIKKSDILLTQLETPNEYTLLALKHAKKNNMTTILNAAPMNDNVWNMIPFVDILIVNEVEMSMLSKEEDLLESCRTIANKKNLKIIITKGSKGHIIYKDDQLNYFESFKAPVIDTTGAGDTFCGVFAAALSMNINIEDATKYAAKAASIAIQQKGAQAAMPLKDEIFIK